MAGKTRRYLLLLFGVLALGILVYKFRNSFAFEGFSWASVAASVRHANLPLLLLALAAIYACYAVRSLRWMRFCRALGKTNFWNVYSATLAGFTCSFLLGRAAEPVRPALIAKKDSLSMPGMFGVYVLERIFDMAATAVLAGFALLSFERKGLNSPNGAMFMGVARSAGAVLLVGLAGAIVFLIYFRYHGAGWLARKLQHEDWRKGWREKVAVLLEGFSDGLRGIRTWADLGALVAYTAAHWLLVVYVYLWIVHAFGGELASLGLAGAALALAFTLVGSAAQLPGGVGGSQVASFLVLTLIFGVQKEPAAVVTIVIWLITFAGCCIVGLPLLLKEGWSMGDLRRLAREEEQAGEEELLAEAESGGEMRERPR